MVNFYVFRQHAGLPYFTPLTLKIDWEPLHIMLALLIFCVHYFASWEGRVFEVLSL